MNNTSKATAIGGATGGIGAYLAWLITAKTGVPLEITSGVVAVITALVSRWAAKLTPDA